MTKPMVDFGSKEFSALARGCIDDLKAVFQTDGHVFAFVSLGHGAWEAVLQNLVRPNESVLMPQTGRFSMAWKEMAEALGIVVFETDPFFDRAVPAHAIYEKLVDDRAHAIGAVCAVHVETSSSAENDIAAIREAIDRAGHPALLVVDAIASLGVIDLPMDRWGIDVVLTASQKGLMLPPGLAFVAVNDKARGVARSGGSARKYWDWSVREGSESYQWFYGTPPIQMIHGLRESLDMIFEEGLENVFARHRRLATATRASVEHWGGGGGLGFHLPDPLDRSNVVTAVRFADESDAERVRVFCRERLGVSFGGGIGPFAGKLLRIGHMGDINEAMLLGALGSIELAMTVLEIPHREGGVSAAAASLATWWQGQR